MHLFRSAAGKIANPRKTVNTITLNIDGKDVKSQRKDVLEAALERNIHPHLPLPPDLSPFGACRLCIVRWKGCALAHFMHCHG